MSQRLAGEAACSQLTVSQDRVVLCHLVVFDPSVDETPQSYKLRLTRRRLTERTDERHPQTSHVVVLGVRTLQVPAATHVHVAPSADHEVVGDVLQFLRIHVVALKVTHYVDAVVLVVTRVCLGVTDDHLTERKNTSGQDSPGGPSEPERAPQNPRKVRVVLW